MLKFSNGVISEKPGVPRDAGVLGFAGVIPFAVGAGALHFTDSEVALFASRLLAVYGALILSFLGGILWGVTISRDDGGAGSKPTFWLAVSVLPSLFGWAALAIDPKTGMLLLAASFVAMYAVDAVNTRRGFMPAWYLRLRAPLTVAVTALLLIGAGA